MTTNSAAAIRYRNVMMGAAMATKMLATQRMNRRINQRKVTEFAEAMKRGEWETNAQPIMEDDEGHLINGQHRLLAVIESGCTVPMTVATGVPVSAIDTIDTGTSRTLAHVLEMRGEGYSHPLAAALGWLHGYQTNGVFRVVKPGPTRRQLLALLEAEPGLRESVRASDIAVRRQRLQVSGALLAALHFVLMKIDDSDATFFLTQLRDGIGLASDDPIYQMRERLLGRGGRIPVYEVTALLFKAWNAYRRGDRVRQLRFTAGGKNPEQYPTPI